MRHVDGERQRLAGLGRTVRIEAADDVALARLQDYDGLRTGRLDQIGTRFQRHHRRLARLQVLVPAIEVLGPDAENDLAAVRRPERRARQRQGDTRAVGRDLDAGLNVVARSKRSRAGNSWSASP